MSLVDLPPELIANVVEILAAHDPKLANYALISDSWKHTVESHTFSSLRITSNDLDRFTDSVSKSHAHRRAALRTIDFTVVLPTYDDDACARFEREHERSINNNAFTAAMQHLFTALSLCEGVEKARPITLRIQNTYSPMDMDHRDAERYSADQSAFDMGQRQDLWQHRYEHSFLKLQKADTLPALNRVTSFSLFADSPRYIEPATSVAIVAKLPKLQSLRCELYDGERKFPATRTQQRQAFGSALDSHQLATLQSIHLKYQHEAPFNERFVNADVRGESAPLSDSLSDGLRRFTQAQHITKVTLDGPICIDASFFWSDRDSQTTTSWPNLKELYVTFSAVRPDGGWYFDRDPSVPPPDVIEDGAQDSEEEDDESDASDLGSEDSFFKQTEEPPDQFDETRERRLTGVEPTYSYRASPTAELEKLLEAAARASAQMSHLKTMAVGVDVQPSTRTNFEQQSFDFDFVSSGDSHWKDHGLEDASQMRLYWTVPTGWRMSERLESLWQQTIDQNGIVRYEEW